MMKRALSTLWLVAALALPTSILAAPPASVAPLLQSFVDKHEVAGAVALVIDSTRVLSVETVGPDWFGHGGAHTTHMEIRPAKGVAIVWMVQHGGFPGDGGKAQGVFKNWALERFGK